MRQFKIERSFAFFLFLLISAPYLQSKAQVGDHTILPLCNMETIKTLRNQGCVVDVQGRGAPDSYGMPLAQSIPGQDDSKLEAMLGAWSWHERWRDCKESTKKYSC